MNYKNEPFLTLDANLQTNLEDISSRLLSQLNTEGQYVIFNNQAKFGEGGFKKFWEHVPINNSSGNKYSKNEHKGVYAFAEMNGNDLRVLYVGISQTIRRRFFKHTREKNREAATWAYTILKHQNSNLTKEEIVAMIPELQNSLIKNCRFTFVPVESNMMLHLAEVYCANKLKSHWNSFETH